MAEPPAKKKREFSFRKDWEKGRPWLKFDEEAKAMKCDWCTDMFSRKGPLSSGHRRDAWVVGCKRLKVEVVREHEHKIVKMDKRAIANFPFERALAKWHSASQRRTTTATSTAAEREELAGRDRFRNAHYIVS